jgi:hypothetical protein
LEIPDEDTTQQEEFKLMLGNYQSLLAKYDRLAESMRQQNEMVWFTLRGISDRLERMGMAHVGLRPEARGSQTVGDQSVY